MQSEPELPIAVLLSGGGTTLQNLLEAQHRGELPIRVVQVISSKPGVQGIERARHANLPNTVIERRTFSSAELFSAQIFDHCRLAGAKLVCLAGFLQLLRIPADYDRRVLNIHPSLLPAFGGKGMYGHHVHEAVLSYGAKVSGCTVHFADNEFDHGPIVLQRTVSVLDRDTPETLAARVFSEECLAYPEAIRLFGQNRLQCEGRLIRIIRPES